MNEQLDMAADLLQNTEKMRSEFLLAAATRWPYSLLLTCLGTLIIRCVVELTHRGGSPGWSGWWT